METEENQILEHRKALTNQPTIDSHYSFCWKWLR